MYPLLLDSTLTWSLILVRKCREFSSSCLRPVTLLGTKPLAWGPLSPCQFLTSTATKSNDGAGTADCDSRRAVGPTKTIRGVYMTQLNRLQRLAVLSALREWPF